MRQYQASVFQTPDGQEGQNIDVSTGTEGGSVNFLLLAEAVDNSRDKYYEEVLNPTSLKFTIADAINNLDS